MDKRVRGSGDSLGLPGTGDAAESASREKAKAEPEIDREGAEARGNRAEEPDNLAAAQAEDDGPSPEENPADLAPVHLPIEDALDLHSFRPNEVASVVEEYLGAAHEAGFREVRIIHGRGIGMQREIVRAVLGRSDLVVSFADGRPEQGGWGATIAILRP